MTKADSIISKYIDSFILPSPPLSPLWNKESILCGKSPKWNYIDNCMITALLMLYDISGDKRLADYSIRFIDSYVSEDGSIPTMNFADYNLDNINGGKNLFRLWELTGEERYRQTATDLLDLLLFGKWYSPKGIMNERQNYNQDDGGMFKGIFVRYLTQWLLSGRLDSERQYRYTKWLLEQARAAELSAINKTWYIINPYWTHQYHLDNDVHDTSRQQTGMMLMEAIDELRRAGLLQADYSLPNPHIGKPFRYYRLVITETQGSGTIMLGSWKLIGNTSPTSVTPPTINNSSSFDGKSYNLMGISASAHTTGIHIHNGIKFVNRQ